MRTALVVPTVRPRSLRRFREEWQDAGWDETILVYDGPRSGCPVEWPGATLYCWDDYEGLYGRHAWIFTRRDSACRCFGFLRAVAGGADVVITLDDDCYPTGPWDRRSFVSAHLDCLEGAPRWTSSVPGLRVRGLPVEGGELLAGGPPVTVNMGLWSGVPDLGAAETLDVRERGEGAEALLTRFVPPPGTRVMSPHQVFPFSGMNVAFRSAALPALYFPRMGSGSPYARFDDIWCGLLLQRICALTGDVITVGEPWVRHDRASDVHENLRKEAPGVAVNERYWRVISELPLEGEDIAACALSAARALARQEDAYLAGWGRALATWVSLCGEATSRRAQGASAAAPPTSVAARDVGLPD